MSLEDLMEEADRFKDALRGLVDAVEKSSYNANGNLSPREDAALLYSRDALGLPPRCRSCGQEVPKELPS